MLSQEQLEDEVQVQMNLLPDVMNEDPITTTNHQNISQFLSGTEWLDVLKEQPLNPSLILCNFPGSKIVKPRSAVEST